MNPLVDFTTESLKIEGITRPPLLHEIAAMEVFLELPVLGISDVERLVKVFQPNAQLRDRKGLNVTVGDYRPPPGGPQIRRKLEPILDNAHNRLPPWGVHVEYERLHPFTDGNGRSGRAIWLWQWRRAGHAIPSSFLLEAYYQALAAPR